MSTTDICGVKFVSRALTYPSYTCYFEQVTCHSITIYGLWTTEQKVYFFASDAERSEASLAVESLLPRSHMVT